MENLTIIEKKEEWDHLIDSFEHSDFYHTFEYHLLSKNELEVPILIKYTEHDKVIALPLLMRKIDNTSYNDFTSVYGYAGPLSKNIDANFNNINFKNHLQNLFIEKKIISVFSRLNPFIPYQDVVLKNIGHNSYSGQIVTINLKEDLENQKMAYNRRLKTYINKARESYTVKKAEDIDEIMQFIKLYYANMTRVNAKQNYFFDENYFFDLANATKFKTEILLAFHNNNKKAIAGAMFIKKNKIVQYHLSGVHEDYLHLNPVKLLIDEMRIISSQENFEHLNLGGGIGSMEDSLFRFKSGFSKNYNNFHLWKFIADPSIYDSLIDHIKTDKASSYFPLYRI
jgi:hypothetical protein